MISEYKFIHLPIKEGVRHAKLIIDDVSEILQRLDSEEYKNKILKMLLHEDNIKGIGMDDGVVNISEVTLYTDQEYKIMDIDNMPSFRANGLYIRIEQNRPDRRSIFDNAVVEVFILNGKMMYSMTSCDDNRYNVNYLDNDDIYKRTYEKINADMGKKLDIRPFKAEYDRQVELQDLKGILKGGARKRLDASLITIYGKIKKEGTRLLDNIKQVAPAVKAHVKVK